MNEEEILYIVTNTGQRFLLEWGTLYRLDRPRKFADNKLVKTTVESFTTKNDGSLVFYFRTPEGDGLPGPRITVAVVDPKNPVNIIPERFTRRPSWIGRAVHAICSVCFRGVTVGDDGLPFAHGETEFSCAGVDYPVINHQRVEGT